MFAKLAKTKTTKKNPSKNSSKKTGAKQSSRKSAPQIILFIGLTQNGKSSVIRSILKYAGDEEQASKVERGHDSLSQTKEVNKYSVNIVQKKHTLQYKDGKELVVVGEDVEEDEVEEKEVLLNETVSLILLDSPGLSDSGNPLPKKGETVQALPRRIEDERHKLKVLKALSEVGKINSVCFVVKKHQQFGWDFQRHIRDYVDIFEMSSLLNRVNFHVLHTQIDRNIRFQVVSKDEESDSDDEAWAAVENAKLPRQSRPEMLWTVKRAQAFDSLTGIKAMHHWMDNQPYSKDPVAQYFSKNALAELIRQLSRDTSAPCTSLHYPKSELHKLHDKELGRSYNNLIFGIQTEKDILESETQDLEKELRPKIKRREGYESEIGGLNSKIYDLDKGTLETITSESKSKDYEAFNPKPTLYFRIDTDVTIRKIERNPDQPFGNYASWIIHSSRDNKYYADFQINDWYTNAKASVVLKGYKRDIYAAEINKYRKQRTGLQSDLEKVNAEISKLEEEIKEKNTKIERFSTDIASLESEKLTLDGESFALESFIDKAPLFLAGGIYSISQAYGLERMVAKVKLPRHRIDKQKINHELWSEKRDQQRKELARNRVLTALKQDIAEKTRILNDLEALFIRTDGSRQAVEAGIEANLPYTLQLSQLSDTNHDSYLLNAVDQVQGRGKECHKLLDGILVKVYTHLEARDERVHEVLKKMRVLVAKSAAINEDFKAAAQKHRVRVEAATKAIEMFNADEVPIGTFTVLFKGIEKELSNPYMMLYEDIAECFGEQCA